MKILIAGSQAPGAIENYYIRYLRQEEFSVQVFTLSDYYSTSTIPEKIKFRYAPKLLFRHLNQELEEIIKSSRPDVLWVFKGIEIFPDTLQSIRKSGVILVNYNPDHPFIRSFVSNGGKNVTESVPLYDLHFCYSRDLVAKISTEYNCKTGWLPFGYELSEKEFSDIQSDVEIVKCCFIGNPDKERAEVIDQIAKSGLQIDVYGYKWEKFLKKNANIRIFSAVLGLEYWEVLRKYRVQINIFRPYNFNSHNMRTFEIPACGGIQVAPVSDEHSLFFSDGEEIYLYSSTDELIQKIRRILDFSQIDADLIRNKARERVLQDNHRYEDRAMIAGRILRSL